MKSRPTPQEHIEKHVSLLAEIKRFNERWEGDQLFRERFSKNPTLMLQDYKININPNTVRYIWDEQINRDIFIQDSFADTHAELKILQDLVKASNLEKTSVEVLESIMDQGLKNKNFKYWRNRQRNRLISQTIRTLNRDAGHYPAAFELSKGCSGGCWFCSVSAEKLQEFHLHTNKSQQEWKYILDFLRKKLGPAASESFCYWATDPLDNADYEKFALDFKEVMNSFPSTTTALSTRNIKRTKEFLKLCQKEGGRTRFSVTSLKMLNDIHKYFSAEELFEIELVLQLDGAMNESKSNAGRARERALKDKRRKDVVDDDQSPSCVSGFLFNMIDKRIALISPCLPCDRWPNGHRIHEEVTFETSMDVAEIINQMIAKHMSLELNFDHQFQIRNDIKLSHGINNGAPALRLTTNCKTIWINNCTKAEELCNLLSTKKHTPKKIIYIMSQVHGQSYAKTSSILKKLFDYGMIEDDPKLLKDSLGKNIFSEILEPNPYNQ